MKNSQDSPDLVEPAPFDQGSYAPRLRIACWGAALLLGALQAWAGRHHVNADGVSYLDLADTYLQGGWRAIINGYWSPLYPWLLSWGLRIFRPSPYWDAPVAHLVNFAIYVGALGSFDFFWRACLRGVRGKSPTPPEEETVALPEWAWLLLGFSLFVWTTLQFINLSGLTPDLCVATLDYFAAGLLVRIHSQPAGWRAFMALGLVLGFGYLAKTPMFPMAFVFLGAGALAAGKVRLGLPRVAMSFLVFLLVASPFLLALSRAKGRPTFGDSGKLNYAFYVDGFPAAHWRGEPPGSGVPLHPTCKVSDDPPIFEFAIPIHSTYALAFDPSYWNEGIKTHFDVRKQVRVLVTSLIEYYPILVIAPAALVVGVITLLVASGRGRRIAGDAGKHMYLLIPALAAVGMYALVHVEGRFVAAYVVLFWAAILQGIRLPVSPESRRVAAAVSIAMFATLGVQIICRAAMDIHKGLADPGRLQWEVAEGMKRLGIEGGDKVASVETSHDFYWARLVKVSVVSEVYSENGDTLWWTADPRVKARVFRTFARTGAKVVVADRMPPAPGTADWQRVGNTPYYVHFLTLPGT
jgi:hypothetical protein